jgi:hypothetical protein
MFHVYVSREVLQVSKPYPISRASAAISAPVAMKTSVSELAMIHMIAGAAARSPPYVLAHFEAAQPARFLSRVRMMRSRRRADNPLEDLLSHTQRGRGTGGSASAGCRDTSATKRARAVISQRSRAMKHALAAIILALSLTAPVAAGPLEDATAAYDRGDYAVALRLFRPLANQGDAYVQTNLGLMYHVGQGVPQNYDEAAKWFWLAANRGVASAQALLGFMYADGQGVPQDYVQAHMWFSLSAAQGGQVAAIERDSISSRMTPAQIAEAPEAGA